MLLHKFFFFKQKTAYEMRISDWSSDVCSSDLHGHGRERHEDTEAEDREGEAGQDVGEVTPEAEEPAARTTVRCGGGRDRKSVVWGKSVSVRVDLVGRSVIKKKTTHTKSIDRRIIALGQ